MQRISIHALLAESDYLGAWKPRNVRYFYPRSPCGERLVDALKLTDLMLFLSTLSLRRATIIRKHSTPNSGNFYPRSPCGERPALSQSSAKSTPISIHALLAESDAPPYNLMIHHTNFYPRSPCGERPSTQCKL